MVSSFASLTSHLSPPWFQSSQVSSSCYDEILQSRYIHQDIQIVKSYKVFVSSSVIFGEKHTCHSRTSVKSSIDINTSSNVRQASKILKFRVLVMTGFYIYKSFWSYSSLQDLQCACEFFAIFRENHTCHAKIIIQYFIIIKFIFHLLLSHISYLRTRKLVWTYILKMNIKIYHLNLNYNLFQYINMY